VTTSAPLTQVAPAPQMSALAIEEVQGKICSLDDPDCAACSA